mgnify:CR=1 FL=1
MNVLIWREKFPQSCMNARSTENIAAIRLLNLRTIFDSDFKFAFLKIK